MEQLCPHFNTANQANASYCAACGLQLTDSTSQNFKTGAVLQKRYRIVSLLGQGGFGAVYRAWDMSLKRPCAVKENLETGQQAQNQFHQEASVLANLSHPNLPRVTDHFVLPGQGQYLVMDFVDGQDLDSLIRQVGPLVAKQGVEIIAQIADALGYLHSQSRPVIHRDIKPANIRVRTDGRAFLVDFGLVKLFTTHKMTTAGARGITPGYAPPEQYGQGGTDPRTDVYALGATLYTLLTGMTPQESVTRAARDTSVQAHLVNPGIPIGVSQVIARAMALDPARRYQSAAEFKSGLEKAISTPISGGTLFIPPEQPAISADQLGPSPVSKPVISGMAIGALIMMVVSVIIVGIGWLIFGDRITSTPIAHDDTATEEPVNIIEATSTQEMEDVVNIGNENQEEGNPKVTDIASPTSPAPPTSTPTPVTATVPETRGEWIAYAYGDVRGELDLYRMNMVTGQNQQLTSGEILDEGPTFSPDGRSLVYVSCRGDCELYQIDLHSLTTKKLTSLSVKAKFPNFCNVLSKPWIVFEGRDGNNKNIWKLELDTGEVKQMTTTNADSRPMWSPDCSQIVFGRAVSDTNRDGQITTSDFLDIYILEVESNEVVRLTFTSGVDEFNYAWSSDGEWISYCQVSEDTNNDSFVNLNDRSDLYIMRPDGGGTRSLVKDYLSVFSPSWSPDGRSVMFSAYSSEGRQSVWSYSLDTGELTQHTGIGPYYHPEWSQ